MNTIADVNADHLVVKEKKTKIFSLLLVGSM